MNEKSLRMTAYNFAKWYGKKNGLFTPDRVDRALGYLMSDKCYGAWNEYETHVQGRDWRCNCPDRQYRGVFCKHIIALLIDKKIAQLKKEMN